MPLVLVLALMMGDPNVESKQFELEAETWINAPVLRFPEDRSYAVLFFSTETNREETEKLEKLMEKLGKAAKGKAYWVMALSPDKEDRVRRLVKKLKVDFPVGAGSKSHQLFKIEDFPQLIILERAASQTARWDALSIDRIDSLVPAEPTDGLVSGAFDQSSSNDVLTRYARQDPDNDQRERAVKLLREKMPTEEFLKLCDALLAEGDPSLAPYGAIDYQRHLADPSIIEKQPRFSAGALASQARRENPTDPRWTRVDEYDKALSGKTLDQVWIDYQSSLTDDPADLLIRKSIAIDLANRADKVGARSMLMRMLPGELDSLVRLHMVGAMTDVCAPGDLEAANFLEAHLAHETDIRNVRPLTRTSIRYLRGEID